MDELKIKSEFTKGFITGVIRKILKKKYGYNIDVCFDDDILLSVTDTGVHLHITADIDMSNDDLSKLRKNVIGL